MTERTTELDVPQALEELREEIRMLRRQLDRLVRRVESLEVREEMLERPGAAGDEPVEGPGPAP